MPEGIGGRFVNQPDPLDVARDAAVDDAIRRDEQNPMISTRELACILIKKQYDECTEVLAWASENVWSIQKRWVADCDFWHVQTEKGWTNNNISLYEALLSAYNQSKKEAKS